MKNLSIESKFFTYQMEGVNLSSGVVDKKLRNKDNIDLEEENKVAKLLNETEQKVTTIIYVDKGYDINSQIYMNLKSVLDLWFNKEITEDLIGSRRIEFTSKYNEKKSKNRLPDNLVQLSRLAFGLDLEYTKRTNVDLISKLNELILPRFKLLDEFTIRKVVKENFYDKKIVLNNKNWENFVDDWNLENSIKYRARLPIAFQTLKKYIA